MMMHLVWIICKNRIILFFFFSNSSFLSILKNREEKQNYSFNKNYGVEVMKWHLKIEHLNTSNEHIINFNTCDNFQSKSDVGLIYDIYDEMTLVLKIK
jgi:hypothetical protein